jgi:hypothetical protein
VQTAGDMAPKLLEKVRSFALAVSSHACSSEVVLPPCLTEQAAERWRGHLQTARQIYRSRANPRRYRLNHLHGIVILSCDCYPELSVICADKREAKEDMDQEMADKLEQENAAETELHFHVRALCSSPCFLTWRCADL